MQIEYNSSLGKILLPGTYSFVWGYSSEDALASLSAGGTDIQTGAFFDASAASFEEWLSASAWSDIEPNSPYIILTPDPLFLPLPEAYMATCYVDWEGPTGLTDGEGEVAVFIKYTDQTYERIGEAAERPSGWMMWAGPEFRTLIDNLDPAVPNPAKTVAEFRLLARNLDPAKGMRIRNFRMFESVTSVPTGGGSITEEVVDSVTYSLSLSGGISAGGRQAGIIGIDGWPHAAGGIIEVPADGSTTVVDDVTFPGLPAACLGGPIRVYDGYGNVGVVAGVNGAKTLPSVSLTCSAPTFDPEDGLNHVTLTGEILSFCGDDPAIRLHQLAVYREYSDGEEYAEAFFDVPGAPLNVNDEFLSYPTTYPADSGRAWRIEAWFSRYYPDLDLAGGGTGLTVYFPVTATVASPDITPPTIQGIGAAGWGNRIYAGARASDSGGLVRAEFYRKRTQDPEAIFELFHTDEAEAGATSDEFAADFETADIETWTVKAIVYDTAENAAESDEVEATSEGADPRPEPNYYIEPDFKVYVLEDTSVLMEWTSWDQFMPIVAIWNPVVSFDIYRWSCVDVPDDPEPLVTLPGTALGYHDTGITEPGVYEYRIIGTDSLGQKRAVGCIASIAAGPTVTYIPFVEEYLGDLPQWTAAHPRNYSQDTLS